MSRSRTKCRESRMLSKTRHTDERFMTREEANASAMSSGPEKKHWSIHDMRTIKPITQRQQDMAQSFFQGDNLIAYGSAGTGKTLIACWLAIRDAITQSLPQTRVIIVRSTVAAREMGFLPGTQEEKMAPFENPYRDMFAFLFGRARTYDDMKKAGLIEFMSTAFIRGLTWDNAVVIVDECQNMTWEELNTVVTRIGDNSRLIVCGDVRQNDLYRTSKDKSGMEQLLNVANRMDSFAQIEFMSEDIVRSGFVKEWITACNTCVL